MDVSKLVAFEQGELDEDGVLDLFAELIQTGLAWQLQGFYGRTAASLIDAGLITQEGIRTQPIPLASVAVAPRDEHGEVPGLLF